MKLNTHMHILSLSIAHTCMYTIMRVYRSCFVIRHGFGLLASSYRSAVTQVAASIMAATALTSLLAGGPASLFAWGVSSSVREQDLAGRIPYQAEEQLQRAAACFRNSARAQLAVAAVGSRLPARRRDPAICLAFHLPAAAQEQQRKILSTLLNVVTGQSQLCPTKPEHGAEMQPARGRDPSDSQISMMMDGSGEGSAATIPNSVHHC